MQYEPTAPEILEAIAELLRDEVQPLIADEVVQFRLRVALNALGIVSREFEQRELLMKRERQQLLTLLALQSDSDPGEAPLENTVAEFNQQLLERVRAGEAPEGTFDHLVQAELAQVSVANPKFLKRVLPDVRAAGLEWTPQGRTNTSP